MKGFLGCCYQCDVPPETIQNFCGLGRLDISGLYSRSWCDRLTMSPQRRVWRGIAY